LNKRADFAQRLHDVMHIAGAKSVYQTRAYACGLLDNDFVHMDEALDIMVATMLGLQTKNPLHWRVSAVPFEIAVDGRLEGECLAQGINMEGDPRSLLRRLETTLGMEGLASSRKCGRLTGHDKGKGFKLDDPNKTTADAPVMKKQTTLGFVKHTLFQKLVHFGVTFKSKYVEGISEDLTKAFEKMNIDGDDEVSEEEFVQAMSAYLRKLGDDSFTEDDLVQMYRYIDLDGSGGVTVTELAAALSGLVEPVMPAELPEDSHEGLMDDTDLGTGLAAVRRFRNTNVDDPLGTGKCPIASGRRVSIRGSINPAILESNEDMEVSPCDVVVEDDGFYCEDASAAEEVIVEDAFQISSERANALFRIGPSPAECSIGADVGKDDPETPQIDHMHENFEQEKDSDQTGSLAAGVVLLDALASAVDDFVDLGIDLDQSQTPTSQGSCDRVLENVGNGAGSAGHCDQMEIYEPSPDAVTVSASTHEHPLELINGSSTWRCAGGSSDCTRRLGFPQAQWCCRKCDYSLCHGCSHNLVGQTNL